MIKINDEAYRELRCQQCRKCIAYEYVYAGRIAIKCGRCGFMNEIRFKHFATKSNIQNIKSFQIGEEVK